MEVLLFFHCHHSGFLLASIESVLFSQCYSLLEGVQWFQATIQILTSCQGFWFYWLFLLSFCFSPQCKVGIFLKTTCGEIASCCCPSSLLFSSSHKTGLSNVFPLHCCASMWVNWLIIFFCLRAQVGFCSNALMISWLKWFMHIFVCYKLISVAVYTGFLFWQLSNLVFSSVWSLLQWRNVWAQCRWGPRWWSSAVVPRVWCGSSIWMNTSPASAGGHRARMKRPRVSVSFPLTVTREQRLKACPKLNLCHIVCDRNGLTDCYQAYHISVISLWIAIILPRASN